MALNVNSRWAHVAHAETLGGQDRVQLLTIKQRCRFAFRQASGILQSSSSCRKFPFGAAMPTEKLLKKETKSGVSDVCNRASRAILMVVQLND